MLALKSDFFYSTYPGVRFSEITFVEYHACISFANCKLEFVYSVLVNICDPTKSNFVLVIVVVTVNVLLEM